MLFADVVLSDTTATAVAGLLAAMATAIGVLFYTVVAAHKDRIADLTSVRDKLTEVWLRSGVPPKRPDDGTDDDSDREGPDNDTTGTV